MNSSTLHNGHRKQIHAAIIMDGNGRWARMRGQARVEGHREGALAVRRVVEAAPALGIRTLTLYAFSTENWKRPPLEVNALMRLFQRYLASETPECIEKEIQIKVVGRRDRLEPALVSAIERSEQLTADGSRLRVRIAVDYSAQDAILRAAARIGGTSKIDARTFSRAIAEVIHDDPATPDIDLLIRTGGELRLSDLSGWDSGYAELVFSSKMWPEFDGDDLRAAVEDFWSRERRFGGLPTNVLQPAGAALNGV